MGRGLWRRVVEQALDDLLSVVEDALQISLYPRQPQDALEPGEWRPIMHRVAKARTPLFGGELMIMMPQPEGTADLHIGETIGRFPGFNAARPRDGPAMEMQAIEISVPRWMVGVDIDRTWNRRNGGVMRSRLVASAKKVNTSSSGLGTHCSHCSLVYSPSSMMLTVYTVG